MYIFKVEPFGYRSFAGGDCLYQMYPLLSVLQNKLQNGDSLLYYWNSGLGGNFLSSYFYYLASPFNLIIVLLEKGDLNSFISFSVMFKLAFSAGAFGCFLSRRNGDIKNNILYIALACGYALSNFMCSYYYDIMWIDSLMVFPLIMLGQEKLLKENKPIMYIVTLAYSLYCNYYISFIICIFLVLWFFVNNSYDKNSFLKKGLRFAFCSILSAGMSAIALITSFIGLTKTVSSQKDEISHEWYGNIFEVIRKQFVLSKCYMTTYRSNVANIYCGTIVIFLVFSYFFIGNIGIKEKIKRLMLIILLLVSMNESLLNYVWHGFHKQHSVPNRFAFVFIFVLLVISADAIDAMNKDNLKSYIYGMIIAIILPLICYFFVDFDSFLTGHQVISFSIILSLFYGFMMIASNYGKKIISNTVLAIVLITLISELIFNSMMVIKYDIADFFSTNIMLNSTESAVNSIKDDSFYRSEVIDGIIENENSYHNINGINVFNSTVNSKGTIFMQYMGIHTGINRINYDQPLRCMSDFFGIKYFYVYNGNNYFDDSEYAKLYDQDGVVVYKNPDALSLGFGADKEIADYLFADFYDVSSNINTLFNNLNNSDNLLQQIIPEYSVSYNNCEVAFGDTSYLSFMYDNVQEDKEISISFNVPQEGEYYVDVRQSNEDNVCINVNGNIVRESIFAVNGLSKIGEVTTEDNINITISDNKGHKYQENDPTSEVKVFVYRLDKEVCKKTIEKLKANQLDITSFSSNKFSGKVHLEDNQVLFTTIPYDKGWHIYENGKELTPIMVGNAFVGVDAGAGEHTLVFKYIPEGFILGTIISIISIIVFVIVCIYYYRNKNADNGQNDED